VDVHIGRIRKKVEDNATHPLCIVTVRGAGYRFEDEPA
jgi:DNA-binding response OmpR family regulator